MGATLTALRKKHSEKKLIESRLVTNDAPVHSRILNPILSISQSRILPLRPSPKSKPFDLLTEHGTVSGRLPASATLHDHVVQQGIQKTGVLCLAFSTADLAALRSVGIPASLSIGLEDISRKALEEFCYCVGLGGSDGQPHMCSDSTQASPSTFPQQGGTTLEEQLATVPFTTEAGSNGPVAAQPRLFLVAWTPSRLSLQRSLKVDEVVRSLADAGEYLEVDLDDVFLWRPAQDDLRRIDYCLAKGQRKHLQRAIIASLRRNAESVTQVQGDADESSSLLATRTRLQEALSRSSTSPGERRRRLRLHREAIDTAFVTPVLEQAVEEPDPKRRSHLAGLARINQVLFPAVDLYLAKRDKEVAKRGAEAWDQVSDVRDLMKMFDTLFKFTQESE
jgi:hypothetical protein